jgi:hypothetical protein
LKNIGVLLLVFYTQYGPIYTGRAMAVLLNTFQNIFSINSRAFLLFVFLLPLPLNMALSNQVVIRLNCLSKDVIRSTLNQKNINIAVSRCSSELRRKLQPWDSKLVSEDVIKVVLAMVVTHNTTTYGSSRAIEYSDLIKAEHLHCGNQPILMGYLLPNNNIHIIGFDGGAVGNHAQVIYVKGNVSFLLDPTTSVVTPITYNALLQGKPPKYIIVVHPNLENPPVIQDTYTKKVVTALENGSYLPTDILYYFESLNHFLNKGPLDPFITPAGMGWRRKNKIIGFVDIGVSAAANIQAHVRG